jgi:rhamnosyltransferase
MAPPDMSPSATRLAIVVTAYLPGADFFEKFASAIAFCDCFIVVDNTPAGHAFGSIEQPARMQILQDGQNKGLGRALNIGIDAARRAGADTVILFDQDSSPDAVLLRRLLAALEEATLAHGERVGIGPRLHDDAAGPPMPMGNAMRPLTCLPTSGLLFRLNTVPADHHFTEELFLDFVDFDWCWRLGAQGWRFFRAMDVVMPHRLGLAQRRLLGLTYHVPAPYRHYFQFRDTLRLTMRSYVPLYSKCRLAALLPLKALAYPFMLDRGLERARWMALGVVDALRSVSGIGAARDILTKPP